MIAFAAALAATLFLGALVGFFTAALLSAGKREDECRSCTAARAVRYLRALERGADHGE